MTAKEKAWELYPNPGYSACESYEEEAERCGKISGFVAGAEWMLEKAVNFIRQHDSEMIVCNTEDDNDSFITEFKKTMEE